MLNISVSIIERVRAVPIGVELPIIGLASTVALPGRDVEWMHLVLIIKRGNLGLVKVYHFLCAHTRRILDRNHLSIDFVRESRLEKLLLLHVNRFITMVSLLYLLVVQAVLGWHLECRNLLVWSLKHRVILVLTMVTTVLPMLGLG